jgi:hypothetical protein
MTLIFSVWVLEHEQDLRTFLARNFDAKTEGAKMKIAILDF